MQSVVFVELTLRERVAIVCRTGPLVSFLRSGSSCKI